jgi:RHS repeat-associated protein
MKNPKFQIFQGQDKQFYFRLLARNGRVLLRSEGYVSRAGCENGIHSVQENAATDARYRRSTTAEGQYYFVLVAANGAVIGTSQLYVRKQNRDQGIEAVKTTAPTAPTEFLDGSGTGGPIPEPTLVASPINGSVATSLATATEFLYTGTNPIQTGVTEGTIDPRRVAVLRGQVFTRAGQPLSGVKVSVLDHPEFGSTFTRADGMFDLAVNGGDQLTVRYEKDSHFRVQRQITAPWHEYAWLPDVVLVLADAQVTLIDLSAEAAIQVARGSRVSDRDGDRQATLLFPRSTTAEMVLPDGSTQALENLQVRETEFTIGSNGPAAMPGELPANSGYTYAVEFTADEALGAGAKEVRFSQPLIHYVENFIGFPPGTIVPVGFYDRDRAAWIPADNGRVIRILSITNSFTDLDIDGSDQAADAAALAELGVTDAERQQLASLYQPGQSLWRVPIPHFSPWDCNWPFGAPSDAKAPNPPDPERDGRDGPVDHPCEAAGSVIDIQNQVLGEVVDITGTPFSLHYCSDRVMGRRAASTLEIPLSGDSVPDSLKRIDLEIFVAGRRFTQGFPAAPSQRHTFTWDGRDAYGRPVQGAQPVKIRICYLYDAVYMAPNQVEQSFAQFSASGATIGGVEGRQEFSICREMIATAGVFDARARGLGGWSPDIHHAYDPTDQTLYLGDGTRRSARSLNFGQVITTVAGAGPLGDSGDGGPATEAELFRPAGIAVGSDGSLYIADSSKDRIRQVDPNGIITTIAGTGDRGFSGDGGPATGAQLRNPQRIALGPDGSLYFSDTGNDRIRRVGPGGIITTVAGTGTQGFSGDEGPATEAELFFPKGIAAGSDGSLYIADSSNNRIRRIGPDGTITTVAGGELTGILGDGGPATQATLIGLDGIALGPDGSLYIATHSGRIRRVGPDGIITTVAGTGTSISGGDGGPATEAGVFGPADVAIGADGSLYIAERFGHRIRRVGPDGIITTVAGTGTEDFSGDGGPATKAQIGTPEGIAVGPDDTVYLSDTPRARFVNGVLLPPNARIRRLISPLPASSGSAFQIASEDGLQLYTFDSTGRHLATLHALSGAPLYRFEYDADGRLAVIRDGDDNITRIERDTNGPPTAIEGPFGHRTTLTLNGDGYLERITDPAGLTIQFTYHDAGGLLAALTDPRSNVYSFTYDDVGRLIREDDPAGGFKELRRHPTENGFEIRLITKLLHETSYRVERLPTGETLRENACCGGNKITVRTGTDGTSTTTYPNGTVARTELAPDPRWGMQVPFVKAQTITTRGGLESKITTDLKAELTTGGDPLTLARLIETVNVNGRAWVDTFDVASLELTSRSPMGRVRTTRFDSQGRIVATRAAGVLPVEFAYNDLGQLATITQGSSIFVFDYDDRRNLISITDPLSHVTRFEHDLLGRVLRQVSPDSQTTTFAYDEADNMVELSPPGRAAYLSVYNAINLEEQYVQPAADGGSSVTVTRFEHNADHQLERVTLSDDQTIEYGFDAAGRLNLVSTSQGQYVLTYAPTTGDLVSIEAPDGGTLTLEYDDRLQTATHWSGPIAGRVLHTYNHEMLLSAQSVQDGQPIQFEYDDDGLLIRAGALGVTRDVENGLPIVTELGRIATITTYDDFGDIKSCRADDAGVPFFSADYSRDALGRIERVTEAVGAETHTLEYGYDEAGRLESVRVDGVVQSLFAYDANGNRLSHTGLAGTENGTYDAQDRLLTYGGRAYRYTPTGVLQSKVDAAGNAVTVYDYDVLGSLTGVTLPNGDRIEYVIDGMGRRIGKRTNGVTVRAFLYQNSLDPVAELDADGRMISQFVYATHESVPALMIRNGATFRFVADYLGSVRLVVNAETGEIAQRLEYDSFGAVVLDTNPGFQPFGFAGGLYDPDTRLVRFGARDYDPEVGRWTAKDPLLFAGGDTNLYAYAFSNPINLADPLGLAVVDVAETLWDCIAISRTYEDEMETSGRSSCDPVERVKKAAEGLLRVTLEMVACIGGFAGVGAGVYTGGGKRAGGNGRRPPWDPPVGPRPTPRSKRCQRVYTRAINYCTDAALSKGYGKDAFFNCLNWYMVQHGC